MYTFFTNTTEVVRDLDGVVVAPAQSVNDLDFAEYNQWVADGNTPAFAEKEIIEKVTVVTPRQLRMALNATGLRSAVELTIISSSGIQTILSQATG